MLLTYKAACFDFWLSTVSRLLRKLTFQDDDFSACIRNADNVMSSSRLTPRIHRVGVLSLYIVVGFPNYTAYVKILLTVFCFSLHEASLLFYRESSVMILNIAYV